MILHQVKYANPEKTSWYGNYEDELSEWDIKHLEKAGIVEAWYTYGADSYDGSGYLIGKSEKGLYIVMGLGHCSCYGPCDDASEPYLTLEEVRNYDTDDYIDDIFKNLLKELN